MQREPKPHAGKHRYSASTHLPCKHTAHGKQTPVYHGHPRIPLRACGVKMTSAGATMDNENYTKTVLRRAVPSCVYLATFDQPCKEATQTPGRSIAHTHSTRDQHNEAPPRCCCKNKHHFPSRVQLIIHRSVVTTVRQARVLGSEVDSANPMSQLPREP